MHKPPFCKKEQEEDGEPNEQRNTEERQGADGWKLLFNNLLDLSAEQKFDFLRQTHERFGEFFC